jgi:hypothetical protein
MRGANQKFRFSTAALNQQLASPPSQATRGTGLHDIDLANQELTHHQKDAALSLAGFLLWTRSSRLQDSSTRTLNLVPIGTAIKRCHCLRLYGVDMGIGGSVTEASYRIMACKSRNYAFNHYPRDNLLPMLSSKIAMELRLARRYLHYTLAHATALQTKLVFFPLVRSFSLASIRLRSPWTHRPRRRIQSPFFPTLELCRANTGKQKAKVKFISHLRQRHMPTTAPPCHKCLAGFHLELPPPVDVAA